MKKALLCLVALILLFSLCSCSLLAVFEQEEATGESDQEPLLHQHAFEQWETATAPTCSDTGLSRSACTCGVTQTRPIAATGEHAYNTANICTKCGKAKASDRLGEIITLGEYPQTVMPVDFVPDVTDQDGSPVLDARGYYAHSDGSYYARLTVDLWSYKKYGSYYDYTDGSDFCFTDGTKVTQNSVRYFKVEPLRWRVIGEADGKLTLLCESIITARKFDDYSIFYNNSNLRAWLNEGFLNAAFDAQEKKLLMQTGVDNSPESTNNAAAGTTCSPTEDYVYLPSYRELTTAAFGFSADSSANDPARQKMTTDYARACGAYFDNTPACEGYGAWWTRSPLKSDYTQTVNSKGNVNVASTFTAELVGVVPAITVSAE